MRKKERVSEVEVDDEFPTAAGIRSCDQLNVAFSLNKPLTSSSVTSSCAILASLRTSGGSSLLLASEGEEDEEEATETIRRLVS